MEPQTVHIPTNYTDSGKIFGFFEVRNTVEALIIALPVLFVFFYLLPFSLTVKIISCAVILAPLGGFALIGIQDSSLFTFLITYVKWQHRRKQYLKSGGVPVEKT